MLAELWIRGCGSKLVNEPLLKKRSFKFIFILGRLPVVTGLTAGNTGTIFLKYLTVFQNRARCSGIAMPTKLPSGANTSPLSPGAQAFVGLGAGWLVAGYVNK